MLTRLVYIMHIMAAHDAGQTVRRLINYERVRIYIHMINLRTYLTVKRFIMHRTVVIVCNDMS